MIQTRIIPPPKPYNEQTPVNHSPPKASHLTRFTHEALQLLRLGMPLIIGALAIVGMTITDTLMAGQASAYDLAGLAVGAGLWSAAAVLIIGLVSGLAPIVGQLFGARQYTDISQEVHQSLWIALFIGVLISLLAYNAPYFMTLMTMDSAIADISGRYLQAIAWGAPALALGTALRTFSEAVGRTRITMLVNLAAFLINILLDYILVFGQWGFPALGSVGAAYASSLIYWAMLLAFALQLKHSRFFKPYELYKHFQWPRWHSIKHQLHLGVPISIGSTGEVLFFGIIALMLAPLGATIVGGHQIAQSVAALIFMLPFGQGQAIGIRIAHSIGAGKTHDTKFIARSGLTLGLLIAALTAAITISLRHTIVAFYTDDPDIQAMAANLLLFCSAYQLCDSLQVITWGALRGFKDTRVPMLIMLFSYWCIGFPLGYSLALTQHWGDPMGAQGFWIGIIVGLSLASILLLARLRHLTNRLNHAT